MGKFFLFQVSVINSKVE